MSFLISRLFPSVLEDCSNVRGDNFFQCLSNKLPSLLSNSLRAQIATYRAKSLHDNLIRQLTKSNARGTARAQSSLNGDQLMFLFGHTLPVGLLLSVRTSKDLCKEFNFCD